jgi:hypothetical protein
MCRDFECSPLTPNSEVLRCVRENWPKLKLSLLKSLGAEMGAKGCLGAISSLILHPDYFWSQGRLRCSKRQIGRKL